MRIAFFGTPPFAAHLLERILTQLSGVEVSLVVTQPDKKVGRKQILTQTPVKQLALQQSLEVFDQNKLNDLPQLLLNKHIDLAILYAYGKIIPAGLLETPTHGFWNIHPSLLPLYRGASPLTYPLLLGESHTGVSLMQMDELLDHGPILTTAQYTIQPTDTHHDLEKKLTDIGFDLLKQTLERLEKGEIDNKPQNHIDATYTRLIRKEDGFVPFNIIASLVRNAPLQAHYTPPIVEEYYKKNGTAQKRSHTLGEAIYNMYRALKGWPGLWTLAPIGGIDTRLKITEMTNTSGIVSILKLQLEGKNEVPFETFNRAYSVFTSAAP
ncbi:MAG: hypothetical protein RI947_1084 [Candidatus Parcubacteria bacterium]|jgi:methionyl-tRNA formyltransferase